MAKTLIRISPDGSLRALPGDAKGEALLQALGCPAPTRASHIEPVPGANPWQWTADMAPLGGPKLGPFASREEALTAEHAWIEANWIGKENV